MKLFKRKAYWLLELILYLVVGAITIIFLPPLLNTHEVKYERNNSRQLDSQTKFYETHSGRDNAKTD